MNTKKTSEHVQPKKESRLKRFASSFTRKDASKPQPTEIELTAKTKSKGPELDTKINAREARNWENIGNSYNTRKQTHDVNRTPSNTNNDETFDPDSWRRNAFQKQRDHNKVSTELCEGEVPRWYSRWQRKQAAAANLFDTFAPSTSEEDKATETSSASSLGGPITTPRQLGKRRAHERRRRSLQFLPTIEEQADQALEQETVAPEAVFEFSTSANPLRGAVTGSHDRPLASSQWTLWDGPDAKGAVDVEFFEELLRPASSGSGLSQREEDLATITAQAVDRSSSQARPDSPTLPSGVRFSPRSMEEAGRATGGR